MSHNTIIIPKEEYDKLIETLEVLMDQDLVKRINTSLEEFSQGKKIPFYEVKKKFF